MTFRSIFSPFSLLLRSPLLHAPPAASRRFPARHLSGLPCVTDAGVSSHLLLHGDPIPPLVASIKHLTNGRASLVSGAESVMGTGRVGRMLLAIRSCSSSGTLIALVGLRFRLVPNLVRIMWLNHLLCGSGCHAMVSYRQQEEELQSELGPGSDPVPVSVSFVGPNHLVIEPNGGFRSGDEDAEVVLGIESGSPPDRATLEMYQYFANRTSPCGEKGARKQKRRNRGRGKSGLVTEHFVRINHYCPTPTRPLQGLWKGICENRSLEFYLVAYDDIGGITCRRVGESGTQFSGYSPLFWTPNADFIEPPFSKEEYKMYTSRGNITDNFFSSEARLVSRMLCINSSYDLVIPDLAGGPGGNLRNVEGRVWEYDDGTFGFGFLRDDYIIDLKHIALNGQLLDSVGKSGM